MKTYIKLSFIFNVAICLFLMSSVWVGASGIGEYRAYMPLVIISQMTPTPTPVPTSVNGCPTTSTNVFDIVPFDSTVYKENRLTDENADFRLSVLGYATVNEALQYVGYNGNADGNAPKFRQIFSPSRQPTIVRAYRRYDWNWNESAPPLYGSRGGLNSDFPVAVIDVATSKGESIRIPNRGPVIWSNNDIALVLYASEHELALTYSRSDSVTNGYVVYMLNFCVDPNLVSTYRAQLSNGRRATGDLPAIRGGQVVGVADQSSITLAVRDSGRFMDPRSNKDWWQ